MGEIYSKCKKYQRRDWVDGFNMSTYQSCNNCKFYTRDRRCAYDMDFNFTID